MPNKTPEDTEMSDAVYAKSIIEELWPIQTYGRGSVIARAYDAIKRVERSLPKPVLNNRDRQWTERRVRSIVDDEKPRLERYEILDLEKMAVKEGRDAYRKSIERASRMAAFLAVADEDFHRPEIDRLRQFLGGMDRPGDTGAGR